MLKELIKEILKEEIIGTKKQKVKTYLKDTTEKFVWLELIPQVFILES